MMKTRDVAALLALAFSYASNTPGQSLEWVRQLGTSSFDTSQGVSADGLGNVYITGLTDGDLEGLHSGSGDAFISKYDAGGAMQWTRQLGTSDRDESRGVSADGQGNVYMTGITAGNLGGQSVGGRDAFLAKYDAEGSLKWTRQLGSSNGSNDDVYAVSADRLGNIYISGLTWGALAGPNAGGLPDAFISKYDDDGALQWARQLGTNGWDEANGVSADGLGNVYIAGRTNGDLADPNGVGFGAFLTKYDAAGTRQWTRQFNEASRFRDVSADALGNVYVSGDTHGDWGGPNAGLVDAFVSKFDEHGALHWTQQFGTSGNISEYGYGVSADGLGGVYISGLTLTFTTPTDGERDAFIRKYDADGALQWAQLLSTNEHDSSNDVWADGLGNVYISGMTRGDLGGPNAGDGDAFLAKFTTSAPGDTNGDGRVDLDDLNNVRNNFGGAGLGDTDGDGRVDLDDLNNVRNHFGDTVPVIRAVPEAGGGAMLMGIVACWAATRRRARFGLTAAK